MSVVELQHSGIICTSKVETLGGNTDLILGGNVNYYARYLSHWKGTSSGTQSDPYLITSADDWDDLSTMVNNGYYHYNGMPPGGPAGRPGGFGRPGGMGPGGMGGRPMGGPGRR